MTQMLRSALAFPATALRYRELLGSFVWRDLAARYEGSLLGRLWPVIYPAVLLAVYHFVFAQLLNIRFGSANPYVGEGWVTTFFMLSGILPWVFFSESIGASTGVVLENANLIKKIAFPSQLLPTFVVITNLIQFSIGLTLFVLLYVTVVLLGGAGGGAEGTTEYGLLLWPLLWLPLVVFLQVVFTTGLGMLLAALNVFIRDVRQIIPLALLLWMFLTPIFYDITMVEKAVEKGTAEPWMITVMQSNPLYHLMEMYRGVFLGFAKGGFPLVSLGIFSALAFTIFLIGHSVFQRSKGYFSDEV